MARATEGWAAMEFKGIDLGDKRLNPRVRQFGTVFEVNLVWSAL